MVIHPLARAEGAAALVGCVAAVLKRVALDGSADRWRRVSAVPWWRKSSISQSMLLLVLFFEGEGDGDICRRAMRRMEVYGILGSVVCLGRVPYMMWRGEGRRWGLI